MMKYIDKYDSVVINIKTIEDSHKVQRLLYSYDITWGSDPEDSILYNDSKRYYVFQLKKISNHKRRSIFVYGYNEFKFIKSNHKTDGKVYELSDLYIIKRILKYGDYKPMYKSKNIVRKI